MQIIDQVLADSVQVNDTVTFTFFDENDDDIDEIMFVNSVEDAGYEIVIKGESFLTGDSVEYPLTPDHRVDIVGSLSD